MTGGLATGRLREERKLWRKDHPIGFYARPAAKGDGSSDMFTWECAVPGKKGGDWEGGTYKCQLKFSQNYPANAPQVVFTPPLFHPNVYTSGNVCLSIIGSSWRPSTTIREILVGLQELLDEPNFGDPANGNATNVYRTNKAEYKRRVLAEARKHKTAL